MVAKTHMCLNRYEGKVKPWISAESSKRLRGHEKLLENLLFVAEEEAAARGISLIKIDVLPAWSHEYNEKTGVVVHAEVQATDEQRFSLWEAISERIDSLYDKITPKEKKFLTDDVSVLVDRA